MSTSTPCSATRSLSGRHGSPTPSVATASSCGGRRRGHARRSLGNWRALLERFAEDHARVYLRPRPDANAALRRLHAAGTRIGAFTTAPEPLARVAATHLGVARRLEAIESGAGALDRLLRLDRRRPSRGRWPT